MRHLFQLTSEEFPESIARERELEEANVELQKKIELLERRLQAAAMEGEQAAHRFQVYAEQCSYQQTALRTQVRENPRKWFTWSCYTYFKSTHQQVMHKIDIVNGDFFIF